MTERRAILLEDDAVAAEVLTHQLQQLGYSVRVFDSLASLQTALPTCLPAALALIDLHLPDGHGTDALPWLRDGCACLIASSADWTPASRQAMQVAGFAHCLGKPCEIGALQGLLAASASDGDQRGDVGANAPGSATPPVLDDAIALRALGSAAAVAAMRALFRDELKAARARLHTAFERGELAALRAELHRLLASTGFVGAVALKDAVAAMQASMTDTDFARLDQAILACLEAMAVTPGST